MSACRVTAAPASRTLAHGLDFAFGVVMHQERHALARTFARLPGLLGAAVFPGALLLLAAPLLLGWSVPAVGLLLMSWAAEQPQKSPSLCARPPARVL